jgi:hypothetical protein
MCRESEIFGWFKDATGETTLGLVVLAAGMIMAGVVTFLMGHDSKSIGQAETIQQVSGHGSFLQQEILDALELSIAFNHELPTGRAAILH